MQRYALIAIPVLAIVAVAIWLVLSARRTIPRDWAKTTVGMTKEEVIGRYPYGSMLVLGPAMSGPEVYTSPEAAEHHYRTNVFQILEYDNGVKLYLNAYQIVISVKIEGEDADYRSWMR